MQTELQRLRADHDASPTREHKLRLARALKGCEDLDGMRKCLGLLYDARKMAPAQWDGHLNALCHSLTSRMRTLVGKRSAVAVTLNGRIISRLPGMSMLLGVDGKPMQRTERGGDWDGLTPDMTNSQRAVDRPAIVMPGSVLDRGYQGPIETPHPADHAGFKLEVPPEGM